MAFTPTPASDRTSTATSSSSPPAARKGPEPSDANRRRPRPRRILWDYLRLGIPVGPAECLLVFGGHAIGVAARSADLCDEGIAPLIVVSGVITAADPQPAEYWFTQLAERNRHRSAEKR